MSTATILARVASIQHARTKFNPNHDDLGRFADGPGGGAAPAPSPAKTPAAAEKPAAAPAAAPYQPNNPPHPTGPKDVDRYIAAVKATPEYQRVEAGMNKLAAELPPGTDIIDWSLTKHTDPATGKLTAERQELHNQFLAKQFAGKTPVPQGQRPQAILLLGQPGSGKTVGGGAYIRETMGDNFISINADDARAALPEYEGWNASAVHHEAARLAEREVGGHAVAGRYNVVYDGTGRNTQKMIDISNMLAGRGYDVSVVYVDLPDFKSIPRQWERFTANAFSQADPKAEPGRFTSLDWSVGSSADVRKTFETLKQSPVVKQWRSISTDVALGQKPILLEEGKRT